ncbi:MAG: BtrH N-terminal domain-containing protein [bacterium]|nr:BtrH N-terminal domain-containing protein [bacterium]
MSYQNIVINHKVRDNECMWSGVEDMYCEYSKHNIPDYFFFALTGMANFSYERGRNKEKRCVQWTGSNVKDMYRIGADIIGYDYMAIQANTSEEAIAFAKDRIRTGNPVVLGCVDLYEIPYFKGLYHRVHIPVHYLMLTGYNDAEENMYVLDGGKAEIQSISYHALARAMKTEGNFQKDVNVLYQIQFRQPLKSVQQIAIEGFQEKAKEALKENSIGNGIAGMRLLAKEFPNWEKECSSCEYEQALYHMVRFAGDVPSLPGRLEGKEEQKMHWAARRQLAQVLSYFSKELNRPQWQMASNYFLESGALIEKLVENMTSYLLKERSDLWELPEIIGQIADLEEKAYQQLVIVKR